MAKTKRHNDWDESDEFDYIEQNLSRKQEKFKSPKNSKECRNRPYDREDYYRKDRYQDDDR